ncbi:MAG: D-alanyl-D-alanine carboxypeptidase family protein [Patescibacteria group bacterium]
MIAFVLIATTALSLANENVKIIPKNIFTRETSKLPVLSESVGFPILSAQGVLAYDIDSGVTLYEKNPEKPLLPASTTKIMTALIALDAYPLDKVLIVGSGTLVDGQKMGLVAGSEITVENLLYGLMVYSANDAALTLAQNYEGGEESFIEAMNKKAVELGLKNTHFANPVGLDGDSQRSTARDMVLLSSVAMKNPEFAKIVGTKKIVVQSIDGKYIFPLTNINELLGKVDGVMGVKTGWTEGARENLISYIDRDGKRIMVAVLGSQDRFGETKELIDWIYKNYTWKRIGFNLRNTEE